MTRGRTAKGRTRTRRDKLRLRPARDLLAMEDHGPPIYLERENVHASGDRWVEPFLEANRRQLARLDVTPDLDTTRGLGVRLTPGSRLGAVPLLSPATRRVAAGLLVRPRFRWPALGAVMSDVGFESEPSLGDAPLVPGSAREVPPWLIAGPVLRRLEGLLGHLRREFVEHFEYRQAPRGRIDWTTWARRDVPAGRWSQLPCHFADPQDDPSLLAHVRWTLARIEQSLAPHLMSPAGRFLHERARRLLQDVGQGEALRPEPWDGVTATAWVTDAAEAMGWVRDERGLGGSRNLDGLAWHLQVDELWESWVRRFAADLSRHLGLTALPTGRGQRSLSWHGRIASMGSLVPDCILQGRDRTVFVDAKYKRHLDLLSGRRWPGLADSLRDAHRADLHQALAYANLTPAAVVDTVLVYPTTHTEAPVAFATIPAGRKRLRLHLLGLPFGFRSPVARLNVLDRWRAQLAA